MTKFFNWILGVSKLKAELEALQRKVKDKDQTIRQQTEQINSLVFRINEKNIAITRLRQDAGLPKSQPVDFSLKKGDPVKGYLLPHGKSLFTGVFERYSKNGNLILENGKTMSKENFKLINNLTIKT